MLATLLRRRPAASKPCCSSTVPSLLRYAHLSKQGSCERCTGSFVCGREVNDHCIKSMCSHD